MRIPNGVFVLMKEVLRHLLRRPVVGIAAVARTSDGGYVLVRRTDTGEWALPGGTLEWGETLRSAIERELWEEAGVETKQLGELRAVYSDPKRDRRFHAVTILVDAEVSAPARPPHNPVEIAEARVFTESELPANLAHGMADMLDAARAGKVCWE